MKVVSRHLLVGLLVLGLTTTALGQEIGRLPNVYNDASGVYGDGSGGPFLTQLSLPFPGRVWLGGTIVDNGFGYPTGGYFTLGSKLRLGEDWLGGRWLVEGRGHVSYEAGTVFGNLGLERVLSIDPIRSDIGASIWLDGDQTPSNRFGHDFKQVGLTGYLRNEFCRFQVNGYFPIDDTGYIQGVPGGGKAFVGNSLLLQSGLDTALDGFDAAIQFRPISMAMFQGTIDLGGYYYKDSDQEITGVPSFGGVRVAASVQTMNGLMFQAEINHDERFDTTGFFRMVLNSAVFGNYDPQGRDLDPTTRDDHITVVHQDPIFALDPRTGGRYRVVHVDSTNTDPAGGDGTAANPYTTLARADGVVNPGNSFVNDIIFVREGVGPYTDLINLLGGQYLFGDGVAHLIQTQLGVRLFCSDIDDNIPTIGGVTLGGNNIVRGFDIDAVNGNTAILAPSLALALNGFGVTSTGFGTGVGTLVDQVEIIGGVDGVNLRDSNGSYLFTDSDTSNGVGMNIDNTTGIGFQVDNIAGGVIDVDYRGDMINTVASGRLIQLTNITALSDIDFVGGTQLTDVGGGGIFLSTVATTVDITTPQTLTGTTGPGIDVRNSTGAAVITFANTNITDSGIAGVSLNNNAAGAGSINFTTLAINETTGAIGLFVVDTSTLNIMGNNSITNTGNAAIVMNGAGPNSIPVNLMATFNTITSNASIAEGINLNAVAGVLDVAQTTIDDSTLDSILIQNDAAGGLVSNFTLVNITDAGVPLGAFGNGVRLSATPLSTYNFGTLNIETDNGNGLFASTAGVVNVLGGTITANGGAAIIINPTEIHMTFGSVNSTNSVSDGISIGGIANITGGAAGQSMLNIGQTNVVGATGTGIRIFNLQETGNPTDLIANFGNTTIDGSNGIVVDDNNDTDTGEATLSFNNLLVDATNGEGIFIDDDNDAGNGTQFTFNLIGNAATVTATSGNAINITGAHGFTNTTVSGWTFQDVTSITSTSSGVVLDDLNEGFTINGLLDIDNSAGDGFIVRNFDTAVNVSLNSVALNGTGGDSIDVSGFGNTGPPAGTLPSFAVNGGTIDTAGANSVNVANGGANANFTFNNLAVTFGVTNNLTGINVSSGDGTITIANNSIDFNSTTNATGIFVEGNNSLDGFNLGTGVSTNNTSANAGAGSLGFQFNNGTMITGDIEVDGMTFNP